MNFFTDEFFEKWSSEKLVNDIFGRKVRLGGKISFCYIDGNHNYDFVKRDFENVHNFLVSGGLILFDDSSDFASFGLKKLMGEIVKRKDYKIVMKNPNYLFQKI